MDAVEFVGILKRVCEAEGLEHFNIYVESDAEHLVKNMEIWAAAHPVKTRQSVFLEQWPEALIARNGVLYICPANISANYREGNGRCATNGRSCLDCRREFWMQEVE